MTNDVHLDDCPCETCQAAYDAQGAASGITQADEERAGVEMDGADTGAAVDMPAPPRPLTAILADWQNQIEDFRASAAASPTAAHLYDTVYEIKREELARVIAALGTRLAEDERDRQDRVRVQRMLTYEGPRRVVEEQLARSLQGRKDFGNGATITAVTLDVVPERVAVPAEPAAPIEAIGA